MASPLGLRTVALLRYAPPWPHAPIHALGLSQRASAVLATRAYASKSPFRKAGKSQSQSRTKRPPPAHEPNPSSTNVRTSQRIFTLFVSLKKFPASAVEALVRFATTLIQLPRTIVELVLDLPGLIRRLPGVFWARTRAWWTGWRTRAWWKRRTIGLLKFIAHVFNLFFFIHLFYAHIGRVSATSGPSMLPTFATSGEIVIENIISYRHFRSPLVRGDLVTAESPIMRGHIVCKRLIGLPGDVVCVDPIGQHAPSMEHVVVPKGHVWLSGDNADESRDSRQYGPVPLALVKGRIVAKVWPPWKFTIYRSGEALNYLT